MANFLHVRCDQGLINFVDIFKTNLSKKYLVEFYEWEGEVFEA